MMKNDHVTSQILTMLVGLVQCDDEPLLEPELLVHFGIPQQHYGRIVKVRDLIKRLANEYDFLQSPTFARAVEGRSVQFLALKSKLESEPLKRQTQLRMFTDSITNLRSDRGVYDLLSPTQHVLLDEIGEILGEIEDR